MSIQIDTTRPAPKIWRKIENLLLIILIPAATFTITNWGFEDSNFVNRLLLLVNTPLVAIIKGIGYIIANGEDYITKTEN